MTAIERISYAFAACFMMIELFIHHLANLPWGQQASDDNYLRLPKHDYTSISFPMCRGVHCPRLTLESERIYVALCIRRVESEQTVSQRSKWVQTLSNFFLASGRH
ncbi:hypothetical protein I7I53_04566 [Histoplasma capsulatum var. duboisii H88]|uniref:Uncharacterized protein n=1 Tax=Ajellomyces capsulatus (strain H88) TaxID=544711 RepID=A0A8A1LQS2_AJEC8|nr:hypothetical protein I7I53_04566 [Histoplasma capsulatum var. duboisii H88]